MDPVTALGVASAVVQLVDFTQALIRGTYEIYRSPSGKSDANVDLETITTSLKRLTDDLQLSLGEATISRKLSPGDVEIQNICKDCNVVATKLVSALDKLKAQKTQRLWDSFGVALRTVWSEEEVETLQAQLHNFRSQLSLLIVTSIRDQVGRLREEQTNHGQLISGSLQATQDLSQAILKQMDKNSRWQASVINAIHSSKAYGNRPWDVEALPISNHEHIYREYAERFYTEQLVRLQYFDMETRSEGVSIAYGETFEWIFSPPSAANQLWSNFVHFLESEEGLYWITGKPGCGKSTLMKFIIEDKRTKEHLQAWASGKELYISGFYFWCSGGNEIQMTQEGLLRTLLYQALVDFPHLAPLLFPKRLQTFVVFGDQIAWGEVWTLTELLWAFNKFVQETTRSHKIFFVIDGLDEFQGNHSQQTTFIEFIQSLLSSEVKICVSSRPWNVFEDAFHTRPSLKLEDLTYDDIQHFVSATLSSNLGFAALQCGDRRSASNLIHNVSIKACGVFLWVVLVVQSLLEGLTNGERLSDLQKRLDSLPADLETLFWRILKSVDYERVSQLLQIVRASPEPISIFELSYADEDDHEFVFEMPTMPLPISTLNSRGELMRRRLNACSKGLLEPQADNANRFPHTKVGYLHRTVKDFIQRGEVWHKLVAATDPSFDVGVRLCISRLSCLKTLYTAGLGNQNEGSIMLNAANMRTLSEVWIGIVNCIWLIEFRGPKDPKLKAHFNDFKTLVESRGLSYGCTLLQIATNDFFCNSGMYDIKEPNLDIVETLLEYGAKLSLNIIDNVTWHYVLEKGHHRPDLLVLLLRFGADPFKHFLTEDGIDQQVRDFAQVKREEMIKKGHEPLLKSHVPFADWEVRTSKKETPSKWSRLRSRYSLSKRDRS
ncbi:hypothetical protein N431DRAFT_145544 [Stipitochalara longipes BDJ]|nr:hypothetical protein N431DRAFT_145544 [Stipitochalara longipes BDJ]